MDRNQLSVIQFVSQALSYFVFLCFPLQKHCCPLGLICSDCFYWNPHVHCVVVTYLLVNIQCMFPLRLNLLQDFHIPAIVLFPYSLLVLAHWSFAKDYLMNCNSYLIHFLKTHVSWTMSSLSLICQEVKTCLFK